MKKIAFHIQKGGEGKTTITGNVAHALARAGKKTVIADCDPQGNITTWFLSNMKQKIKGELADVLRGERTMSDVIVEARDNLFIVPTFSLDGTLRKYAQNDITAEPFVFKDFSAELESKGFDFLLYDLSPSMNNFERSVLFATDEVLTPLTPEFFGTDGMIIFADELKKVRKGFKAEIAYKAIVVNKMNRGFSRHKLYYTKFQEQGYRIFTVGQDAGLAESQMVGQTIFEYKQGRDETRTEFEHIANYLIGR